tara:strand:- start:391 stop:678 length:288 start_codon:yes stop_codon:yes gene_type:complete
VIKDQLSKKNCKNYAAISAVRIWPPAGGQSTISKRVIQLTRLTDEQQFHTDPQHQQDEYKQEQFPIKFLHLAHKKLRKSCFVASFSLFIKSCKTF